MKLTEGSRPLPRRNCRSLRSLPRWRFSRIRAEWLCLRVLGADQSLGAFGTDVQNAVLAPFAAVVLLPVVPAFLRMQPMVIG
jgi:hypothetical protein